MNKVRVNQVGYQTNAAKYAVFADHYLYMKDGLITKDYLHPFPLQTTQLADTIQCSDEF